MAMRVIQSKGSDIKRIWLDPELTLKQASDRAGMSKDALQARAAALGLPHRRNGRREVIRPYQKALFSRMWLAGVSARVIGDVFGCSYFAVINTANRLELAPRGAGFRPKVTLSEFQELELASALAKCAAIENKALRQLSMGGA